MSPKPIDRSGRFYFDRIKTLLIGDSKPCSQFVDAFQTLHDAIGSTDSRTRNRAFECLYDRYLVVASRESTRFKLRDEAKAVEALDYVFITMHQRIRAEKLQLTSELHMANYIKLGVRYRLITATMTDAQMPLLHADDLQPILSAAGIQVESELEHMATNEAVERALRAISLHCQEKLVLCQLGYSHDEIATKLEITPQSVKNGIYRCRIDLKDKLLQMGIYVRISNAAKEAAPKLDKPADDALTLS